MLSHLDFLLPIPQTVLDMIEGYAGHMRVLDVAFCDGNEYEGLIVNTTKGPVRLVIDLFAKCCEDFGVIVDGGDVLSQCSPDDEEEAQMQKDTLAHWSMIQEKFKGKSIVHIQSNPEREKGLYCHNVEADKKFLDDGGVVCLDIHTCDGEVHTVDIWCYHNGYYPHTAFLEWYGHGKEEIRL